jgi:hypothetical protein
MSARATEARCMGCGRNLVDGAISCGGCGRPLASSAGDVPPGWVMATGPQAGAAARAEAAAMEAPLDNPFMMPGAPRPPQHPNGGTRNGGTSPQPLAAQADAESDAGRPTYVLNPSWRLRPRVAPGAKEANSTVPQFTVPALPPPPAPRRRSRWATSLYWALVGGILATSGAAFVILTLHFIAH